MDRGARIGALIATVAAVAVDQVTKGWALTALKQAGGHLTLPGPVDLTLSFNESNAFGLTPVIGDTTRWFLMSAFDACRGHRQPPSGRVRSLSQ